MLGVVPLRTKYEPNSAATARTILATIHKNHLWIRKVASTNSYTRDPPPLSKTKLEIINLLNRLTMSGGDFWVEHIRLNEVGTKAPTIKTLTVLN